MLPPIALCGNGHNICSSCKQKIQKCPKCRQPLLDTRKRALEKLATPVECPCPNEPHGCTLTFPIALIREHQSVCEYSPLVCPLQKLVNCNWKGHFEEVKHHVTQKHRNWVTKMSGMTDVFIKNFKKKKIIRQNYSVKRWCVSATFWSPRQCCLLSNKVHWNSGKGFTVQI